MRLFVFPTLVCCLIPTFACATPAVFSSDKNDRQELGLTIYARDLALIRDQRKLSLVRGVQTFELNDVSQHLIPESVQLRVPSGDGGLSVREQIFQFALLSPQTLLEHYVGKQVSVIRTHPEKGTDSEQKAEVLAVQNGVVLNVNGRIETGLPARLAFPEVPPHLSSKPQLSVQLESQRKGSQAVELNYLSTGLNWAAHYVAHLNKEESKLDLSCQVSLSNQSGMDFYGAVVQLVSGNVRTVSFQRNQRGAAAMRSLMSAEAITQDAAPQSSIQPENISEFKLYTLPQKTDLRVNQNKQVTLLEAGSVPVLKQLIFETQTYLGQYEEDFELDNTGDELGYEVPGRVVLTLENTKKSGLGIALPAGTIRVYKNDQSGNVQLLGEERLRSSAENAPIRLNMGAAFDVSARKFRRFYKDVSSQSVSRRSLRVVEYGTQVVFKNAKAQSQTIVFREEIPRDAKVISSNLKYRSLTQNVQEWKIEIPAKGKRELNFAVRAQFQR